MKACVTSFLTQDQLAGEQRNALLTVIDEESDRLNRLAGEAVEMAKLDVHEVKLEPGSSSDSRSHRGGSR